MNNDFKKLFEESLSDDNTEKAKRDKSDDDCVAFCTNKNYPTEPQDELDLHGLTREEAVAEIDKFVQDSARKKIVFVRIITGRGDHSVDGSVLAPAAKQKLSELKNCGRVDSFGEIESGGGFDVHLI